MSAADLRDWQAGDGLRCSYTKRSPIPCGPPVKTAVTLQDVGRGRGDKVVRRPLCEHHARGRETGKSPGILRAEAERVAVQRLAHEHWAEFQTYLDDALRELTAVPAESA